MLSLQANGRYGGGWGGKGEVANEGVEVRSYFEEWVKGTLSRTHSVCIWHFKSAGNEIWDCLLPKRLFFLD